MNIFDFFQHINLTADQRNALKKIQDFLKGPERIFILKGYAGSGKTTLIEGLVGYLRYIQKGYHLMAPTGRAAKVINQKTKFTATTIHKVIYHFEELHIKIQNQKKDKEKENEEKKEQQTQQSGEEGVISFKFRYKLRNTDSDSTVFIVDEASMVSDSESSDDFISFGSGRLLFDLISYSRIQSEYTGNKIIFVGDPVQLPPIGMNFSPALDAQYLLEKYKVLALQAEMKEVKRQSTENGILAAASQIRQCFTSGYFNHFHLRENLKDIFHLSYNDYLKAYKSQEGSKIIICYKNQTAFLLNRDIRIDKFGSDLPIQPSDTVIVAANNYLLGIMNGEFAVVSEVSPSVESREVRFQAKGGRSKSVKLTWRRISLILLDENNLPRTINGWILENYLLCNDSSLKPEEQIALYIDFKSRHPCLKENTAEFNLAISQDEYFNCLLLKYGYAITCHKAQGGEWENVFVFWDKGIKENFNFYEENHEHKGKSNRDFYRWAYTAVTRPSKKLFCINPPYFHPFSSMNFMDINIQNTFNALTEQSHSVMEINIEEASQELEKWGLMNAPITIQEHFVHKWYHLKKHHIQIIGWEKVGYEIRYIFKQEVHTAGFKYWVNAKNQFNSKFQKLPIPNHSDKLFATITQVLESAVPIVLNSNSTEGNETLIEWDTLLEEEKPFLKSLFIEIRNRLKEGIKITQVQHLPYRERYTFEKRGKTCVVDFLYNSEGFWGNVLPLENQCNCSEIITSIKEIIHQLREGK